ncbi:MAG: TlpA disulfide reductase family protein [Chitinophagales bacterium]
MKNKFRTFLLIVIFANIIYFVVFSGRIAPKNPFKETILLDSQNKTHQISEYEGKMLIVSYFQTWCKDCRKEMPELMALQKQFPDQLKVLMISDEPFDKINNMKSFLNLDLSFYKSEKPLKELGIHRFPTTYLLDKKGRTLESKVEGIHWNTVEIKQLIEQQSEI